jgi:hypothetical protein
MGGYLLSHVNTEEYIERLGDLVRRNPWQKTWLYDDGMDVLTLEPQMDTIGRLMRFFEETGDRYLVIHTKRDRVKALLEAGAPRNTIVVWSLSGPTQSRQLERLTGTTEERIEAARRCQEAGMTIRYKFKPIVPVVDWRAEADYTIKLALERTRPDNLSMTVLMWMTARTMTQCIRPEMLDASFLEAARPADGQEAYHTSLQYGNTGPFPHEVREQIYRYYLARIRAIDKDIPVIISTEDLAMWDSLGKDLGFTPANYPCGCGAGSTPGKRVLEGNPWDEARAAVQWDGSPVVFGGEE